MFLYTILKPFRDLLKIIFIISLTILSSSSQSFGSVRPWNNYTLRQSYSNRQKGMGQIDAVLLDRTASFLNNPAFLGLQEVDGNDLSLNSSFDKLFTQFKIPETWTQNISTSFKPSLKNIGGFGINFNYTSFGKSAVYGTNILSNEYTDYTDRDILIALSYGKKIMTIGNSDNIIGITLKTFHGKLSDKHSLSLPIVLDIGYLLKSSLGIQYGFTVQNIGDNIRDKNEYSYQVEEGATMIYNKTDIFIPTPFSISTGISYDMEQVLKKIPWFNLLFAASVRSVFMAYDKKALPFYRAVKARNKIENPWEFAFGTEIVFNKFYLRTGLNIALSDSDKQEQFYENNKKWNSGAGFILFDHIAFDCYNSTQFYQNNNQMDWGLSLRILNILNWKLKKPSDNRNN